MSAPDSPAVTSASQREEADARVDAAFARAFASDPSSASMAGDSARIDAAVAKALAVRPVVTRGRAGAARFRPSLLLLAAALAIGAAA